MTVFAGVLYHATLLPGVDFGDTASFQTAVGARGLLPRDAYPLYFALGGAAVRVIGGDQARGLNLWSAACGALACGVLAWLAGRLSRSAVGGGVAGLLLASSYTFWSQAVIAEVYTLHLLLMGLALVTLLQWADRPSDGRLALFFAVVALSFGNHLMTVLILPGAALFLLLAAPRVRDVLAVRVLALAGAAALVGALQYSWNMAGLWTELQPPASWAEALRTFWFDTTKGDWRETMVMRVHPSVLGRRASMYWFDLVQQFGVPGVLGALVGLVAMAWRTWRVAALSATCWAVSVWFAYTYNVGDAHVFFLPSHYFVALAAGIGGATLQRASRRQFGGRVAALIVTSMLAYPAWRTWDDYPALDRSTDDRPAAFLHSLAGDLVPERAVLVTDLNWQQQNALDHVARVARPDLATVRAGDQLTTFPFLVAANLEAGRAIVVSDRTRARLQSAFGDLYRFTPDPARPWQPLPNRVSRLAPGTAYVLALLTPDRDFPLDQAEFDATIAHLTGRVLRFETGQSYAVLVGTVGGAVVFDHREARPFRRSVELGGIAVDVRMESWLPTDTIRRAGFGHVVANRRHVLTLERGVSLVALAPDGRPVLRTYASGLFAPPRRYLLDGSPP